MRRTVYQKDIMNQNPRQHSPFLTSYAAVVLIRIPDRNLEFFPERFRYMSFRGAQRRRIFPPVFPFVILRNEVTKNLFSLDTARLLRIRSG